MIYKRIEERDLSDNVHPEVLIDEIVSLKGNETAEQYPKPIRRIAVYNAEHGFTIKLLNNNTSHSRHRPRTNLRHRGDCLPLEQNTSNHMI
ncbi:hypothetical protein [Prevotella koreensis]|uniref:Uncharacterized protein n=1 Tax=Prevotella koreensis TaxID=2490854 RepID=A0A3S0WJ04_9BACT|nr:hypothetical protein [Prevotella koreensis]RUL58307.1 hypothetical protein EHV08_00015 [Prevotella koreensis]